MFIRVLASAFRMQTALITFDIILVVGPSGSCVGLLMCSVVVTMVNNVNDAYFVIPV